MRQSLYAQYVAEREGQRVFEYKRGFVAYSQGPGHLYLQDLFVAPAFRQSKVGSKLLQYVERKAREEGRANVFVGIVPGLELSNLMFSLALKNGYAVSHTRGDDIILKKEV
jgi:GNAT superfamily N-acetyltransferase